MAERCSVCGGVGADILCSRCGRLVCEMCYDVEEDACVRCTGKARLAKQASMRPRLLVMGFGLMALGLMVTTWALVTGSGGAVMFFPFVFSGVDTPAALAVSMAFFTLFMVSSLLPVYLMLRRDRETLWDEGIYTIKDGAGGTLTETIEFMITTEIPKELEDSIYIEEEYDRLVLRSSKDRGFVRTYSLPTNTEVSELESDYEGSYLLMRVKLRKSH